MKKLKSHYKKREYDLTDFPQIVIIDTVSLCNLKCSMCITKDSKRKKGFMD